ncbi:MAG: PBP1A family penicillin-binding protein [Bdellovibrionaceae bacterium]|nr:PBP1A family penicillin-binding protein [Pseudobdellovibrionaceae bacterium]MDW8189481.1 PBP1A family penicillin-binding protein [Pseudobdellovibrionaceae bacterium]
MLKIILSFFLVSFTVTIFGGTWIYFRIQANLPPVHRVEDYQPLLVTEVLDRNNKKIGEFFVERRRLVDLSQIPQHVIQAFIATEDSQFYEHKGINWLAVLRAIWANIKAAEKVQGASTITQQLVKTLFLTPEKTFERKFKEMLLAQRIERNMTKDEILYLYLNQIFFGQNSYGIAMAAETYFRKPVKDLNVAEAAILAGLPKAPTAYNPIKNPKRSKERQLYVLKRMTELGFISEAVAKEAAQLPIKIYLRESFVPQAHGVVEMVRLLLSKTFGEIDLAQKGFQIVTTIDLDSQIQAQKAVEIHLKELDKRQGFRGPIARLSNEEERLNFLKNYRDELVEKKNPERILLPNGEFQKLPEFNSNFSPENGIPPYLQIGQVYKGVVTGIDDTLGLLYVQVAECPGIIDIDTARWARPFNPEEPSYPLSKFSHILKPNDVVWVRLKSNTVDLSRPQKIAAKIKDAKLPKATSFVALELEQEPLVEGALLTIDHRTQEIEALVGGYDFRRSQFNRVVQALRQTGSAYKTFIYAAALDKGYHPSSLLLDAPVVYENQGKKYQDEWMPSNHGKQFEGEITLRNALIRSLNVPAVKVIEDIGVPYAVEYSRRLGIFSKLNEDFTLALGSSSLTLFEMTKAFAVFASLGRDVKPILIRSIKSSDGKEIATNISLDEWFSEAISTWKKHFEDRRKEFLEKQNELNQTKEELAVHADKNKGNERLNQEDSDEKPFRIEEHIFFPDPNQLISPQTAYLMTSILMGVIRDPNGTAARIANELPAVELAGKTGSTNDYFDGWFIGYSPYYTTGVWVGFDKEGTLGKGEVGGRTALPIWIEHMKYLHRNHNDPNQPLKFEIPEGIEFVKIDYDSGEPAKPGSRRTLHQAFRTADVKKLEELTIQGRGYESIKKDLDEEPSLPSEQESPSHSDDEESKKHYDD